MKSCKFEKNITLSTGECKPYVQKDFQLKDINLEYDDQIMVGGGSNSHVKDVNFINLMETYKGTDKISCLSDKLDNRDYQVKKYEENVEKINMPLIMDDKEKTFYKELFIKKARDKKNILLMTKRALKELRKETSTKKITKKKPTKLYYHRTQQLKLTYLKTFKENINRIIPIKGQIRIHESYYPLDSDFIITNQKNKTEIACLGDWSEFKRIKQIIFDKKEQEYKYFLEEKFPGMQDKAYFDRQIEYYFAWLDSQNSKEVHDFGTCLKTKQNSDTKISMQLNSIKFNSNFSKIYVKQFSKSVQEHIKSTPFMRRLVVYNTSKVFPELIEGSVNQMFFDAVNYTPTFGDGMQGLKWIKYFGSKILLRIQSMRMRSKASSNSDIIVKTPEFILTSSCLKNEQGKIISKRCNLWHQCWVENNNFYSETYASFSIN